jgi:hypothetical protein
MGRGADLAEPRFFKHAAQSAADTRVAKTARHQVENLPARRSVGMVHQQGVPVEVEDHHLPA